MTATWESHPGEEQLRVVAGSPEEVLAEAASAYSRLVERGVGGEPVQRVVTVEASDLGGVLVAFLDELVYLAESEGFVTDQTSIRLDGTHVEAKLAGRLGTADPLVKAATYHDLEFERRGDRWHARIVLDV